MKRKSNKKNQKKNFFFFDINNFFLSEIQDTSAVALSHHKLEEFPDVIEALTKRLETASYEFVLKNF